MNVLNKSVK